MADHERAEDFEELVDLIAGMEDIKSVLDDLTGLAAATMTSTTGQPVECAVTLHRRKRTATIGGSSGTAVVLDRIEQSLGDGPCIEALESGVPVLLDDVATDPRWPEYRTALSAAGVASSLGIPMTLDDDAGAVLDFFAPASGLFSERAIAEGMKFGQMADKALRLAVRIASAEQRADNLKAAMDTRTVIDVACGIIMAQNNCSKDQAFELLRSASNSRNQKLNELAEGLVDRFSGAKEAKAYFDD
ncbi:GAF and ANTAR domain-containing protein [Pseudarthrobacter sp. C4D7]|uniref:GAF and ANTAR domain-containing protein n=1 Tax=Pseudarthrobacter sp. C4D7 TaxID=2735268 RepID=UPI001584FA26|nr:GAF and ANTAR domain-containing protein [Pseudarthrobacter sp. C4D7]NUT69599.1 GAF and ANTAR domain-containing protein [Pseudarthrobacter sp. C4D7]